MSKHEVIVVGGGLAGLCCARRLQQEGVSFLLLEASDGVGGRARSDEVDGFVLDRGFQVLLTAYPEAKVVLDFEKLNLAPFAPGALIRRGGKFHRFVDPWRSPRHALSTAFSPIGSLFDKLRLARLRSRVCRGSLEELWEHPESTTIDALRRNRFSDAVIEAFFRPFLGGVFLDRELLTSSRMFEFVFRMFATGDAALPAGGMGAIARQLADQLPPGAIRTQAAVQALEGTTLRLVSGETLEADRVVVACDAPAAARLLGEPSRPAGQSVTCLYFAAERPPIESPILVLNGDGEGPINNLCVPSQVSPTYAPSGKSLVSVTAIGVPTGNLEQDVRAQLQQWFGESVAEWHHLRTYRIPYALPTQRPPALSSVEKQAARGERIFTCGDYLETASIQGAMVSGRRAAENVLQSRVPPVAGLESADSVPGNPIDTLRTDYSKQEP